MKYKIADIVIEFQAKYEKLKNRSKKYCVSAEQSSCFEISLEDEKIQEVKEKNQFNTLEDAEYMMVGTRFYRGLLDYNGCLLHSSAVVVDDEAYLFSAHSGTGKSTHTSLWLKYLAEKNPYILNDDKPAIRIMEDGIYAYGTPFSGKDDINENKKVKLKAICFIQQAKTNSIEKIEPKKAIPLFFEQTIRHLEEKEMTKLLDILEKILKEIPIYKLCCDMSEEAVRLSYETMKGENTYEN